MVSLAVANHQASLPVAHQLYLPEIWANDPQRRKKAGLPADIVFKTKPQIALDQLKTAQAAGVPLGTVLADAGYGNGRQFRDGVTALGLRYIVGIQSSQLLWKVDAVLPVQGEDGQEPARPQLRAQQITAKELALSLPADEWQNITWREDAEAFTSRFARLRIRPLTGAAQSAPEWLLIEWPKDEAAPTKYWLSTLSEAITFEVLVDRAKLRWRIERDYEELKQEVGLGDYEGRSWRGLHHHITLCIAAYGCLIVERATPPSGPRNQARPATIAVHPGRRPYRPAIAPRAAYSELDCHAQTQACCRSGRSSTAVPVLRRREGNGGATEFVTQ